MPEYIYKHPKKNKYISLVQSINERHDFVFIKNEKWERVFTSPNISIDTKQDCFSEKDFLKKTANMKGNFGDLMDYSKELSEKRSSKNDGLDPIKEKFYKDYSKKRKNKKHPNDPSRFKNLKNLKNKNKLDVIL